MVLAKIIVKGAGLPVHSEPGKHRPPGIDFGECRIYLSRAAGIQLSPMHRRRASIPSDMVSGFILKRTQNLLLAVQVG
jgi:hypothetical protein